MYYISPCRAQHLRATKLKSTKWQQAQAVATACHAVWFAVSHETASSAPKTEVGLAAPSLLRMTPVVAGQTSMVLTFRTTHINPKKRNMFEGPKIIALHRGSSLVNCVDNGRYILVCDIRFSFFR